MRWWIYDKERLRGRCVKRLQALTCKNPASAGFLMMIERYKRMI
jgi:hypothetical protein